MVTIEEVKSGRNLEEKTRHAEICTLFLDESMSMEEIGAKLGITHQAVSYVLSKNLEILKLDANFEKLKRINKLTRVLRSLPDSISPKKDLLDVTKELRAEFEGNAPLIENHFHATYNWQTENNHNSILPSDTPALDS